MLMLEDLFKRGYNSINLLFSSLRSCKMQDANGLHTFVLTLVSHKYVLFCWSSELHDIRLKRLKRLYPIILYKKLTGREESL